MMATKEDWWRSKELAEKIHTAQGGFLSFQEKMASMEKNLLKKISFPENYVYGPVRHQAVQGTEGPVWCIYPDNLRRMPLPIRNDVVTSIFEPLNDTFSMSLVRIDQLNKDEFARLAASALFCFPIPVLS